MYCNFIGITTYCGHQQNYYKIGSEDINCMAENSQILKNDSNIILNKISKILSLEKYSFDKIKYLMKISDFYVGCDSGPAMLSDYLGTKTFVLYGATASLPYRNKIFPIYPKILPSYNHY